MYELFYTNQAKRDYKKLKHSTVKDKAMELLKIIENNPFQNPPPYEKLSGIMNGAVSRRISDQHRLVYQVFEKEKQIKVIRLWTHNE